VTSPLDTFAQPDGMLVVWDCDEDVHWLEHTDRSGSRFERCVPELGSLRRKLATHHPLWLVMGPGIDETTVRALVATAWGTYADLGLAMLGPVGDLRRCERWLRCGCRVYLPDSTPFATVRRALEFASADDDVIIVDRAFYLEGARSRLVGAAPSLTNRQREVLQLIDRHLTNPEIADALHVSENTIEFHVRRLLDKLGARSRMQAVRRASDLGLI
jgi:DNA-binding NarL/FixJ family response regulator